MTEYQKRSREELQQEIERIQELWRAWRQGEITLSEDQFLELEHDYWHCLRCMNSKSLPQYIYKREGNPTGGAAKRGRGRPRKPQ